MPDEWPVDGQVLRYRPAVRPLQGGRAAIPRALYVPTRLMTAWVVPFLGLQRLAGVLTA
jgi:hypothetical protein